MTRIPRTGPSSPYNPAVRARFSGSGPLVLPRENEVAPLAPSQPQGPGPEAGTLIKLPGANFPPAGSRGVDITGDANIAPAANATLVTLQIPDTLRFRMTGIGFGADDEVALGFLTWTVRQGVDPIPGYESVSSAVGDLKNLSDIFINAGSSVVINVVVFADPSAVLTYRYIVRIRGWLYSELEGGF